MRRKIFGLLLLALLSLDSMSAQLTHVKGVQSVGARGGIGTKNKYDAGLTYNYQLNGANSLMVELDHEEATFGYSDFTNVVLLSAGVEYSLWNPAKWFYTGATLAGSVGYDKWECDEIEESKSGCVYGANVGWQMEFLPVSWLSCVIKAQQYLLFGNDDQYLKPNFTLGLRYNFHF